MNYRTDLCIENATGEIQKAKQRAPRGTASVISNQPLLFTIIKDVLASEIYTEHPWAMLFADDLVLLV